MELFIMFLYSWHLYRTHTLIVRPRVVCVQQVSARQSPVPQRHEQIVVTLDSRSSVPSGMIPTCIRPIVRAKLSLCSPTQSLLCRTWRKTLE